MEGLVQAPIDLLLSSDLAATAKLVWLVTRLRDRDGLGTAWIAATSGLTRPTVLQALGQLRAADWDPATAPATGHTVPIPARLLTNHNLGIHARVLYGILLLTPDFRYPWGQCTPAELMGLAHISDKTIHKALGELVRAEWIILSRPNRRARFDFQLTFPGFARGLQAMDEAQHRLQKPGHYGEKLMREYLTLLIDSDSFQDDVYPGFLVNPRTQELLQFDRFYPPDVAFEFNGPHHYRKTKRVTAAESTAQQERDLIKRGICYTRRITLVTVHDDDLSLEGMRQKVGSLLPLRDLTGYDLLIDFLQAEVARYLRSVRKTKGG